MSGLCGSVSWGGGNYALEVERMLAAAPWRSLDGSEVWSEDSAALGHGRLTVTPEDEVESQPFDDGAVCVVADCRLDDRERLTAQLHRGMRWRDEVATDVELIARAYHRWGSDFAGQLIGDFAFAIWDRRHQRLLIGRDPMGMRPLYYHSRAAGLVFASEIKQLLAHNDVPRRLNEKFALSHLAGINVPLEQTPYEDILQLVPGTTVAHDRSGQRLVHRWVPEAGAQIDLATEGDYAELLRETLQRAVKDRLRASRGAGILLSGGMDSGSVASVAGKLRRYDPSVPELHAYSWKFEELPQCDERHISRHITTDFGMPETDIGADDLWPLAHYPEHGPDPDDPNMGAFQALLEHAFQRAADNGTRLLLGGDRGDLIVGPQTHLATLIVGGRARDALTSIGDLWRIAGPATAGRELGESIRPVAGALRRRYRNRGQASTQPGPWLARDLMTRLEVAGDSLLEAPYGPFEGLRGERHAYIFSPYRMRLMTWVNRSHARAGLEFADPFSDRRLASLVLSLPQALLNRSGKRLLRAAMSDVMPQAALDSSAKILPTPLFHRGLQTEAREVIEGLLHGSRAAERGWVDSDAALAHYADYRETLRVDPLFWQLVCMEMWLERNWV